MQLNEEHIMNFIARILLIFTLATSFIACTKEVTKLVTQPANPQAGNSPNTGPTPGGGDPAGGNGLCGKPVESYSTDITQLEEYKTVLQPIGEKIKELQEKATKESGGSSSNLAEKDFFKTISRLRTWYIACIDLSAIEKEKIGMGFSKDPVEQLALQTESEIFIDGRKWDKMKVEERGHLLLHELMMSYYMFRFQDFREICGINEDGCAAQLNVLMNDDSELAKAFEPEDRRSLAPLDYSNIRGATSFLKNNFQSLKSDKHFKDRVLRYYKFDPRFYSAKGISMERIVLPENFEIKSEELAQFLSEQSTLGNLPSYCQLNEKFAAQSNCSLEIFKKIFTEKEKEMIPPGYVEMYQKNSVVVRLNGNEKAYMMAGTRLSKSQTTSMCASKNSQKCLSVTAIPLRDGNQTWYAEGEGDVVLTFYLEFDKVGEQIRKKVDSVLIAHTRATNVTIGTEDGMLEKIQAEKAILKQSADGIEWILSSAKPGSIFRLLNANLKNATWDISVGRFSKLPSEKSVEP
jgi:hypothetical protein